jgi:hypothetical protein
VLNVEDLIVPDAVEQLLRDRCLARARAACHADQNGLHECIIQQSRQSAIPKSNSKKLSMLLLLTMNPRRL